MKKELYENLKTRGLCVNCFKTTNNNGKVKCDLCSNKEREKNKIRYANKEYKKKCGMRRKQKKQERLEKKLCTKCGATAITRMCDKCKQVSKENYIRLKENKICVICKHETALYNKTTCYYCLENKVKSTLNYDRNKKLRKNEHYKTWKREYDNSVYNKRRQNGLCRVCESPSKKSYCDVCKEKYVTKNKKKWYSLGLCIKCKVNNHLPNVQYCNECKDKQITQTRNWLRKAKKDPIKREIIKEKKRRDANRQYKNDLNFRVRSAMRARLRFALKQQKDNYSTLELIGCSISELRKHLEKQFDNNMSWDNYGNYNGIHSGWQIDHKIPLSAFDLTKESEILKACHYTNLQPMWAIDNIKKSNKY